MVVDADGRLAGVVTLDQVRRALTAATSALDVGPIAARSGQPSTAVSAV